jgi:hypothetical protein
MIVTNKTYDVIKMIALLILPVAAFIAKLGDIWGLPMCDAISATLIAFDAVMGVVVKILSDAYNEATDNGECS